MIRQNSLGFLHWSVVGEGGLLLVILMLYGCQHLKIKTINDEKHAALLLLENRMAAIEAAADGIGIVDPQGKLIYMNSALQKFHGISDEDAEKFIGMDWTDLYSESGKTELKERVLPALHHTGYWRGNSPIMRKDLKVIDAELSLKLLPDKSMIGTARDVSDRQRASKEKKVLEQQFYQAQKMEAIGRLAGGIAHDFNNILAAISGYAEFLEEDLQDETPQKKFSQNILKASAQAKELVDQMLAFSRQKQSTKDAIDLHVPIQETLSMVKASFPKTIELTTNFDSDVPAYIDGNATQISQLIMNLCVNARDAMEDERGALTVALEEVAAKDVAIEAMLRDDLPDANEAPQIFFENISAVRTRLFLGALDKNRRYICLKVIDAGSGMSRAIMEHIFEPFFTTKSIDKGTGLGLATVHGVVLGHQGALIVDSTVGMGTSFEMYFPCAEGQIQQEPDGATILHEAIDGRILLVEDQLDVQAMMVQMLERLGYEVDACSNGIEALSVLKDSPAYFDLVITDQNMPKMTGMELIQQAHLFDKNLPFILISGYSREKLQDMMKDHPAIKAVLRKPVPRDVLQEKITAILLQQKKTL